MARADALTDLDRHAEAVPLLRRALAVEPDHQQALGLLAYALYHQREYAGAIDAAGSAVAGNPDDDLPRRVLALALAETGAAARAEQAARTAVRIDPESWMNHAVLAQVLKRDGRLPEALTAAAESVRINPAEPAAHLVHADVASELKLVAEAERSYRRALELRPDDAAARHDLAVLQVNAGRISAGVQGLIDAAAAQPYASVARENLIGVVWRVVVVLGLALDLALLVLLGRARYIGAPPSRIGAALVAGTLLLVVAVLAGRTPRGLRPFLFGLHRTQPLPVVVAGLVGVAGVGLGLYALWPEPLLIVAVLGAAISATAISLVEAAFSSRR